MAKNTIKHMDRINKLTESVDKCLNESMGEYVCHYFTPGKGYETLSVDDLNKIKPFIQNTKYWDVSKGMNSTDPNNLIAWGGEGGFWYNFLNKPEWAKEGVHWNKPTERERQLVLSKRKEIQPSPMQTLESKIDSIVRNYIKEEIDTGQVPSCQDRDDCRRARENKPENKEIRRQIRNLRDMIDQYINQGKDTSKLTAKIDRLKAKMLKESFDDDDAFWKQEQQDELDYDMGELTKAFQKMNGKYQAKSRDGKWQTGDRVIVHGKTKNIEGVITDFDVNFMTYEENCDVDYEKDGRTYTMINVPLSRIEKIEGTNESIKVNHGQLRSVIKECVKNMLNKKKQQLKESADGDWFADLKSKYKELANYLKSNFPNAYQYLEDHKNEDGVVEDMYMTFMVYA